MGVISDDRTGPARGATAPPAPRFQPYVWPARQFWPALAVVLAGAMLAVGYFGRRVFLWSDDYVFLIDAHGRSLTWDQLKIPLFGHFSPVSQFTDVLVAAALPDHPWLIRGILLSLSLSVVAAVGFLFTSLFGRTWPTLIGTALAAPALALLGPVNWWTAGVNMMPAFAGVAVCLGATVRVVRGGTRWWALPAIVAFLVAVLALELGVIAVGYALLWTVLFRSRVSRERWRDLARRTWWLWLTLGAIAVWSVLNYKINYYQPTPPPSGSQALDALVTSLFTIQLPLTIGFYDPSRPGFRAVGIAVAAAAAVAVIVVTMVRSRRAWRGWAFALLGWLIPVAAVVLSRVGYIGVPAVEQPMYYYLPTMMLLVGVFEAGAAPWRPAPAGAPADDPPKRPAPRPAILVAGAAAAVAVALAWLSSAWPTISSTNYGMIGPSNSVERTYMANLVQSAHALQGTGEPFSVINAAGMDALVNFQGHNRLSQLTGVHDPTIRFDAPDGPWYAPDPTGVLVPATIAWSAATSPESPAADLTTTGISPTGAGPGYCFTVDDPAATVRWDLPAPVTGGPLAIRTMATVDAATPVRVSTVTEPGRDPVVTNVNPRTWTADEAGRLDTTPEPQIASVVIDSLTVGTTMCLDSIQVGTVVTG
jgi:hypothetical protein